MTRCDAWWGARVHAHTSVVHGAAASAASVAHAPAAIRGCGGSRGGGGGGGGFQKR